MILRASLINAQSTVALVKFFVTCVRIRRIIYEILCYPVIYWRALYSVLQKKINKNCLNCSNFLMSKPIKTYYITFESSRFY